MKRIVIILAISFVAGCGGQNGSNIPRSSSDVSTYGTNEIQPASSGSMLFVTDSGDDAVSVYTFPKGAPVRTLPGDFVEPQGECTDGKNVYIANTEESNVLEFAANGSTPERTIDDPGYFPASCSYDPTTGNLAVANIISTTSGAGSIAVYRNAKGKPYFITSPKTYEFFGSQYDGSGNLFITGFDVNFNPFFGQVAAGSKSVKILCARKAPIGFPGALGWDGKFLVMTGTKGSQSGVFRMQGCKRVGFTPLDGAVSTFYIYGKHIVVADAAGIDVAIYDYPKGGFPIETISGFGQPFGVVVAKP